METVILAGALLTLGLVATVTGLVEISGYFPLAGRPPAFASTPGLLSIAVFALALLLLPVAALSFAWDVVGAAFVVILSGLAVLAGPLLWQVSWQGRVNRPRGLGLAALLYLLAAGLLFSF
ncbi:MAG: hypothetical protein Kilf2KO_26840 [Rhodospirillales bacterium]